jgi:predicted SnoaL-like aldol condensation-catalyzing enzyme
MELAFDETDEGVVARGGAQDRIAAPGTTRCVPALRKQRVELPAFHEAVVEPLSVVADRAVEVTNRNRRGSKEVHSNKDATRRIVMTSTTRKQQIRDLLKSIETGDPAPVAVVNPTKYIQHNPKTHEGGEGLAALFKRLSKTNPRVNVVRVFEDGDHVFAHTEYDFSSSKVGFEVFRFEGDLVVEHRDTIETIPPRHQWRNENGKF